MQTLDDVDILARIGHENIFSGAQETVSGAITLTFAIPRRTDNSNSVLLEAWPVAISL
jgi:hypothetical protein